MPDDNSGQFGSGLSFGGDQQSQSSPPQSGGFGSSFSDSLLGPHGTLFGPRYDPAPPGSSDLDIASNQLHQQIQRAQWMATNPWQQIFGGADEARKFIPQAAEQLQQIKNQQQHQADIQQRAVNQGLRNPGQFGTSATDDTLANEQLRQWKEEGNYNAYLALQGTSPEWAARANLYAPEAVAQLQKHIGVVQTGITALNAAAQHRDQQAYDSVRNSLSDQDWGAIGLKPGQLPTKVDDWKRSGAAITAKYDNANRMVNDFFMKQNQLGQAVPITDDKVASRIEGTYQFSNGEQIPGFHAVTLPGYGDQQGTMGPPGSKDTNNFSKTWSTAPPDQLKNVTGQLADEQVKGILSKYKASRDFVAAANNPDMYKAAGGIAALYDTVGGVVRDVVEGTKAAGNVGLTRQFEARYGNIDKARNAIANEWAALNEWWGKPPSERLAPPSIEGLKMIARFQHQQMLKEATERLNLPFKTAGRYGMNLEDLGIPKELTDDPQLLKTYNDAVANSKRDFARYPMIAIGDRAVYLPEGSRVPGATKVAPVQESGTPSPPAGSPLTTGAASSASGPAGGGPVQPGAPISTQAQTVGAASGGPPPDMPGRRGLTPGMYVNSPESLDAMANRFIQIESGWQLKQKTGPYEGLAQYNKTDQTQHGITDPDDPKQAKDALIADMQRRIPQLQKDNIPATPANLYLSHQQGDAGLRAHLANPDGTAWQNLKPYYRTDSLAKQAVWNNMTPSMRAAAGGDVNKVTSGDFMRLWEARVNGTDVPSVGGKGPPPLLGASRGMEPPPLSANQRPPRMTEAENVPPAIHPGVNEGKRWGPGGSFFNRGGGMAESPAAIYGPEAGAIAGSFAGPLGGMAGGAAGQMLKSSLRGEPQNPIEIAKQGGLGLTQAVTLEGRPVYSAITRAVGAGAVEGGAKAAEGGDKGDILGAAVKGAAGSTAGSLVGEATGVLSRFVSFVGREAHQFISRFTQPEQQKVLNQGIKLADANAVLKEQEPKLPVNAEGKALDNPKYVQAEKDAADAAAELKANGHNPDDIAYAADLARQRATIGEAQIGRPLNAEKAAVGQEYQAKRAELEATPLNQSTKNVKSYGIPDGPTSLINTADNPKGTITSAYEPEATTAQRYADQPAANPAARWANVEKAQSLLLHWERNAYKANDPDKAEAMRAMAISLRGEQRRIAEKLLPESRVNPFMDELHATDERYATVMQLSDGLKQSKLDTLLSKDTPESREFERNFRRIAAGDPTAIAAFNAVKANARHSIGQEAKILGLLGVADASTALAGNPAAGVTTAIVGAKRFYDYGADWLRARMLGRKVRFADFFRNEAAQNPPLLGATGARIGVGAMPQPNAQNGQQAPVQQQRTGMPQAQSYLDTARQFAHGGISEVLQNRGMQPDWMKAGDFLHSDAANTALGVMSPVKTGLVTNYAGALKGAMQDNAAFDGVVNQLRGDKNIGTEEMREIAKNHLGFELAKKKGRGDALKEIIDDQRVQARQAARGRQIDKW